jgi:hypothetical protein
VGVCVLVTLGVFVTVGVGVGVGFTAKQVRTTHWRNESDTDATVSIPDRWNLPVIYIQS